MKCHHIEGIGRLKGQPLPYRAHIKVFGSGKDGISETVESVFIEFDHDVMPSLAERALNQMNAIEESVMNERLAADALSAYMMKRVRGEPMDAGEALH